MKTLYESILGSTKSGKQQLVQEWCEKYQPFNGNYKINFAICQEYGNAATNSARAQRDRCRCVLRRTRHTQHT